MIKLRVKDNLYFFTETVHELLIKEESPNNLRMMMLAHAVVDTNTQKLLKCRPPLEEIIEIGLKEYMK